MYIFTEKDKSAILEMFTALLVYHFINEVPKEIAKFNDSCDNANIEFQPFLQYSMNAYLFDPGSAYSVFNISLSKLNFQWNLHAKYPRMFEDESLIKFFNENLIRNKTNYPWMVFFINTFEYPNPIHELLIAMNEQKIKLQFNMEYLERMFNRIKQNNS